MPSFDFINDRAIRQSLESDHEEMVNSARDGNNKCAVIIAGSIIEALLIDYLRAYPDPARSLSKSDPLQIALGEAVSVCHAEGVIDSGTKDICTVIRNFRNLIHPGLLVRKNEPIPDEDTAQICLALVNKVIKQIEAAFRERRGLTAEQVVSKVQRDTHAIGLIKLLLADMKEPERLRLLLEILPPVYIRAFADGREAFQLDPEGADDSAVDLESLFHAAFDGATKETKERAAIRYVEVLKNGDTDVVEIHTHGLFRASYLTYVPQRDHEIVTSHLLNKIGPTHISMQGLRLTKGITPFLRIEQASGWLDPLIKGIVAGGAGGVIAAGRRPEVVQEAKDQYLACGWQASGVFASEVDKRASAWVASLTEHEKPEAAASIQELRDRFLSI